MMHNTPEVITKLRTLKAMGYPFQLMTLGQAKKEGGPKLSETTRILPYIDKRNLKKSIC